MSNSIPAVRFAPQSAECDAAIAAIEAGLIASGAIDAPTFSSAEAVIRHLESLGYGKTPVAGLYRMPGARDAMVRRAGDWTYRITYVGPVRGAPAMVPQQVQQQQANAGGMRRHVRIADLAHIPTPRHDTYSAAEMEAARAVMVARNLRFDNATGVLSDDRLGWLSRPSNPADHTPFASEEDVMQWAFRPKIANSASRVSRGYSA